MIYHSIDPIFHHAPDQDKAISKDMNQLLKIE